MTPLQARLLQVIGERGQITFADFHEAALYDPEFGYYASSERTGRGGHFLTSPELDPAFGALWARAIEWAYTELGSPGDFEIVELGPGEGGFAAAVLAALDPELRDLTTYRLVERAPAVAERQMSLLASFDATVWSSDISEVTAPSGFLFANEVLDNQPVHLVEGTADGPVELYVAADGIELVLRPGALSSRALADYLEESGIEVPAGHRFEVGLAAQALAVACGDAVGRGCVTLIDYGATATELAARPAGTLVAYSAEGVDDGVLRSPGSRDITSHVNWTVLAAALAGGGLTVSGPRRGQDVLRALGMSGLDAELKDRHRDALADGRGADALAALSRRSALGILTDPAGLGGQGVLVACRGLPAPPWMAVP